MLSDAEISSHAIKALGRGNLVSVATDGGVVSAGGTSIRDIGSLRFRLPFLGWFVLGAGEVRELDGSEHNINDLAGAPRVAPRR